MTQALSQEETKEQRVAAKGEAIANAGRVHQTRVSGVWIVGSGNPRTPEKWYVVSFDEKLDCFVCDCPARTYDNATGVCCHVLGCCYREGRE